jgi:tripartite motif-containing protein 71
MAVGRFQKPYTPYSEIWNGSQWSEQPVLGHGGQQIQISGGAGDAMDAKGNLWVVDANNYRVDEFSSEGAFLRAFGWGVADGKSEEETCTSGCKAGLPGSGAGQIGVEGGYKQAVGIAVAPESAGGYLWIADPGNVRVDKFKPEASQVKFESAITSAGGLKDPLGVAVDAGGNVWVGDWGGKLDEFSASGSTIRQITANDPDGVAIDPSTGNVWTSEVNAERLSEFTPEGTLIRTVGWGVQDGSEKLQTCTSSCKVGLTGSGNGEFYYPTGMSVDSLGNVWVSDDYNGRVQELSAGGEYITQFGTKGSGTGQFWYPWGLTVAAGTAYVPDTGNNRVEKWAVVE